MTVKKNGEKNVMTVQGNISEHQDRGSPLVAFPLSIWGAHMMALSLPLPPAFPLATPQESQEPPLWSGSVGGTSFGLKVANELPRISPSLGRHRGQLREACLANAHVLRLLAC